MLRSGAFNCAFLIRTAAIAHSWERNMHGLSRWSRRHLCFSVGFFRLGLGGKNGPMRASATWSSSTDYWRLRGMASAGFIAVISTTCSAQEDMSDVIFIAHEMHLRENGIYTLKSWHISRPAVAQPADHPPNPREGRVALAKDNPAIRSSRKDFAYAITETCPRCDVGLIHFGAENFGRSNFMTTGRIVKQAGDQWWVTFPGPNGFDICSVSINPQSDIFVNEGNSTSGKVLRNPGTGEDWVESVNSVPKSGPEGHGVDVRFIAKYVAAGKEGGHNCVPDGTRAWEARTQ
jgi:hypothetical protein